MLCGLTAAGLWPQLASICAIGTAKAPTNGRALCGNDHHCPRSLPGWTWNVYAETAPDVFSALSTSAAADLGLGQGPDTETRAKAALAIAEAAGTIERTQAINMLRESM